MGIIEVDAEDVAHAIKKWKHDALGTEAQYQKAIHHHLNAAFPDDNFQREYSQAKTKADIYVDFKRRGAKVVVEVKYKLDKRGEYHRLIGQAWEYLHEWECELVVCICGESDPSLLKLAAEAIGFLGEHLNRKALVMRLG